MESYGAILKKAREEKGLEYDQIAIETSIKSDYLKAIEEEDANTFQDIGETYFVGFLRNYSDYLCCDTRQLMQLYHAKKIQETPVPEGLIVRQRPRFLIPLFIFLGVLGAAIITLAIVFLVKYISSKSEDGTVVKNEVFKTYELTEKPVTARIYIGDHISFPSKGGDVILTVSKTLGDLAIETPIGEQHIQLSEELELDCDGDGKSDLIVYLSDVSSKIETNGAEVRMMLRNPSGVSDIVDTAAIPDINQVSHSDTKVVILEDTRAYPFTLNISFRAGSLFRYKVDRRDLIEDYYAKGDLVTMTASNSVRLWIGNGNTASIQVIANAKTYDLEIPKAGQVVAEDIKWIRDTDGKYKIVVLEID